MIRPSCRPVGIVCRGKKSISSIIRASVCGPSETASSRHRKRASRSKPFSRFNGPRCAWGLEGQPLSLKSPPMLVTLNLDHKIGEFLRAIENQLMWHVRGDAHDVPGGQFLPHATLNRAVAFLVWRGGFRID